MIRHLLLQMDNGCAFLTSLDASYLDDRRVDVSAPELNSGSFTHVWIFGSQGGEISFWEPMITLDFFQSIKAGFIVETNGGEVTQTQSGIIRVTAPIRLPEKVPQAGYYPSSYAMEYDPSPLNPVYRVMLVDLVWFEADE